MALIKDSRLVDDPWAFVGDGEPLPPARHDVAVSVERWRAESNALAARDGRLGVTLKSNQSPALIAEDLGRLSLVALDFPVFRDGRAFSSARLLRERYGFGGEIRAVGDVLRDQFMFMRRCGFDAFEVPDDAVLEDWLEAARAVSVVYQPAADRRRTIVEIRHAKLKAAE